VQVYFLTLKHSVSLFQVLVEPSEPIVEHVADSREHAAKQWQRFAGGATSMLAPELSQLEPARLQEAQEAFITQAAKLAEGMLDEERRLSCTLTWLWAIARA
jgi:hypothetical protein